MILIKHIEFITVDHDVAEITHMKGNLPMRANDWHDEELTVNSTYVKELIRGKRFRRPNDGADITIGTSKQAADVIGIQYECWDNMNRELKNERQRTYHELRVKAGLKRKIQELIEAVDILYRATAWTRIKWLFTGVKFPEGKRDDT